MRKLLSILLLAIFGLPLVSPLLALGQDPDATLPVCCRTNGVHACKAHHAQPGDPAFTVTAEKCRYCPATVAATPGDRLALTSAVAILATPASHPTSLAQTESRLRIARERSRHKRGPPASLLS